MPIPLEYERPEPPPPRRPGTARYWLWYYGGPRWVVAVGTVGAVIFAILRDEVGGVDAAYIAGWAMACGLWVQAGRRAW